MKRLHDEPGLYFSAAPNLQYVNFVVVRADLIFQYDLSQNSFVRVDALPNDPIPFSNATHKHVAEVLNPLWKSLTAALFMNTRPAVVDLQEAVL